MKKVLLVIGFVSLLAACSDKTQEKLGLSRQVPDEKVIRTNAPLTLPPDFDVTPINENYQN